MLDPIQTLEQILPQRFQLFIAKYFPDWRQDVRKMQHAVKAWCYETVGQLARLALLCFCVYISYWLLLEFVAGVWNTYLSTGTGQIYQSTISPKIARHLSAVLQSDLNAVSLSITTNTLIVSMELGIAAQLLALRRLFHEARGVTVYSVWAALCAGGVAWRTAQSLPFDPITLFAISLLPALTIYGISFTLCAKLAPELDLLALFQLIKKIKRQADIREAAAREHK